MFWLGRYFQISLFVKGKAKGQFVSGFETQHCVYYEPTVEQDAPC
jgi:hypothetical protein